jgi:endonuclease III
MYMDNTIIVAIVTGLSVAVPSIIATIVSNNAHDKVADERMKNIEAKITENAKRSDERFQELSTRIEKHNHLVERMAVVERDVETAFVRIDELRDNIKKEA